MGGIDMVVKKLGNLDTPDRPTVASAAPTRDEARRIAAGGSARLSEPNFGGKKATPASLSGRSNLRIWSSLDARGRSPDVRSSSLSTVRRRSRGSLPRLYLKHTSKHPKRCPPKHPKRCPPAKLLSKDEARRIALSTQKS